MISLIPWLRARLRKLGYIVQKYPSSNFQSLPVFDICVEYLMSAVGSEIKFIQVGANDGIFGDPLRKYILNYPWTGVLVEPQIDVFERLQSNYANATGRLIFENVAISGDDGEISMYRRRNNSVHSGNDVYASSVVSSDPNVVAKQLQLRNEDLEEIKVPCLKLDDIIAKYGLADFHLLQVDTEGHDCKVLKTLDISKYKPAIIQFEHGHLKPAEITQLVGWLNDEGYGVLYGGYQNDTVAVHLEHFQV